MAMLQLDDEEPAGAIFILDRELLRTRYKLAPYHDPMIKTLLEYGEPSAKEAEEMVEVGAIVDLKRYLLGVIRLREDEIYPSPRRRSLLRRRSRVRTSLRNRHVQLNPDNHWPNEFSKGEKVDRSSRV
jgi:hypothetical protein